MIFLVSGFENTIPQRDSFHSLAHAKFFTTSPAQ